MRRMSRAAAVVATFLVISAPAQARSFEAGLDAYNAGHFTTAFRYWRAAALKGDAKSQAGLGMLYFRGLGVARDARTSARWFARAAVQGEPTSQFFLGMFFLRGRGVTQSYVRAHMWCDLAMSRGYPDALSCRDEAALHMTGGDLRRADGLVAKWQQAHDSK